MLPTEHISSLVTHDDGGTPHEYYSSKPIHELSQIEQATGNEFIKSLDNFLSTPIRVAAGTWTTTQTANTDLQTLNFPDVLLNKTLIANKLDGFAFLHARVKFQVMITCQPTQSGILLMTFNPNYKYAIQQGNNINLSLTGKTGCPSQMINIASATKPVFEGAYANNRYVYNLNTAAGTMGQFKLTVVVPLSSAAATTVNYSIYASLVDPKTFTPTAAKVDGAPTLVAQIGDAIMKPVIALCEDGDDRHLLEAQIGGELMEREKTRTISGVARAVSSVASSVPEYLGLSMITKPVEWISNSVATMASAFGFSKPTSQNTGDFVKISPNNYMINSDGIDTSHKLSLSATNELETKPELFATEIDEMAVSTLVTRPAYLASYTWEKTQTEGSTVFITPTSPSYMYSVYDSVNDLRTGSYAWLMSQMFEQWRGDLYYKFDFSKTKFHSGRLRATFYPNGKMDLSNLQDIDLMPTYVKTEIFDLSTADQFVFHIPYTAALDWMRTGQSGDFHTQATGIFLLEVVNPLVAPDIVSSTVNFTWSAFGGTNLEFAVPIKPRIRPLRFHPEIVRARRAQIGALNCFIGNKNVEISNNDPMRKTKKLKLKSPAVDLDLATDTNNVSIEEGTSLVAQVGAQPTKSRSVSHQYIDGPASTNLTPHARCVGENIPSLRTLGKRFQKVFKEYALTEDAWLLIRPWCQQDSMEIPDFYSLFSEFFQHYRGSMRLKIFIKAVPDNFNWNKSLTIYILNNTYKGDPVYYYNANDFVSTIIDGNNVDNLPKVADSIEIIPDKEGAIELDVPYYSRYHMCTVSKDDDALPDDGMAPIPQIIIEGLQKCTVDIYRAMGDDFSFATPLGLPPFKQYSP